MIFLKNFQYDESILGKYDLKYYYFHFYFYFSYLELYHLLFLNYLQIHLYHFLLKLNSLFCLHLNCNLNLKKNLKYFDMYIKDY